MSSSNPKIAVYQQDHVEVYVTDAYVFIEQYSPGENRNDIIKVTQSNLKMLIDALQDMTGE